jgi:hypothetical protein
MKNLKDDAKKFRSGFNSALAKSTIRKTTQQKDAKTLAQNFERQTDSMYEAFKHQGRTVPAELPRHGAADRQNHDQHAAGPRRQYAVWSTVKTELNTLANDFDVPGV